MSKLMRAPSLNIWILMAFIGMSVLAVPDALAQQEEAETPAEEAAAEAEPPAEDASAEEAKPE